MNIVRAYDSMKQCAAANNVPKGVLSKAKDLGAPGFRNSKVYWEELKPWLDQHQELFISGPVPNPSNLTHAEIKTQNALKDGVLKDKDIILRDLEIQHEKGRSLSPESVMEFLTGVGTAQNSFIGAWFDSLPTRFSGKTFAEIAVESKRAKAELCELYQTELLKWSKKRKLKS